MLHVFRYALFTLILTGLVATQQPLPAQESGANEAQDGTTSETQEQATDSAPPSTTSDIEVGEAATDASDTPAAAYTELKEQWVAAMATAEAKYKAVQLAGGSPPEMAVEEYREAYQQLSTLLHQMIDAGLAEYAAAAEPSEDLAKELLGIAIYEAGQGHDLDALKITDLLTTKGCERSLLEIAAQAPRLSPIRRDVFDEALVRFDEFQAGDLPRVKIVTDNGEIVIELFENEAPNTVANFISLIQKGFYDGLTFHRVLPGFVAQGGDPDGLGSGGPGYNIKCECYSPNHRKHFPGILAMAHGGRDTGGSQFYLTLSSYNRMMHTANLDGKHTVFGRVISGLDVVDQIQKRDPGDPKAPEADKMIRVEVIRSRDHAYEPEVTQIEEETPPVDDSSKTDKDADGGQ